MTLSAFLVILALVAVVTLIVLRSNEYINGSDARIRQARFIATTLGHLDAGYSEFNVERYIYVDDDFKVIYDYHWFFAMDMRVRIIDKRTGDTLLKHGRRKPTHTAVLDEYHRGDWETGAWKKLVARASRAETDEINRRFSRV